MCLRTAYINSPLPIHTDTDCVPTTKYVFIMLNAACIFSCFVVLCCVFFCLCNISKLLLLFRFRGRGHMYDVRCASSVVEHDVEDYNTKALPQCRRQRRRMQSTDNNCYTMDDVRTSYTRQRIFCIFHRHQRPLYAI